MLKTPSDVARTSVASARAAATDAAPASANAEAVRADGATPPAGYDASDAAYARLRQAVIAAGLMERRYDYYSLRFVTALLLIAGALTLPFVLPLDWGWMALAALAIGFTTAQLGVIGHDAGHMAIFRRSRPNWIVGQFCLSVILGVSFWSWRDRHNRHHVLTNDEDEDPDLELGGLFTLNDAEAATQRGWRRWLTRYQAFLFVPIVTLTLGLAFRWDGWWHAIRELQGRRRVVEIALLTLSAALWASPLLVLGWWWVAVYTGAQWVVNMYLGLVFAPNHKGMPVWATGRKLTFLERQVLSSCNVKTGRLTDYVFCGLNYQIEHHLFPTMPRVNFSRVQTMVKQFCLEHGLPYEDLSIAAAYRQAFAELHRCGQATRSS